MKKIIIIACIALLAAGCKHDTFTISGTIDGGAGKTLWLEEISPEGPLFIDSIPVDAKGHFKYTYKMPYRSLYNLHTTENNYIVTLPDYGEKLDVTAAISHSACTISEDIQANAIIAVTMSGFTAQRISRFKPSCPILACSTKSRVACQTNILFDVYPLIIPEEEREDQLFETAIHQARLGGYIKPGDTVVLTAGVPLGESGNTNMVRVIEVK